MKKGYSRMKNDEIMKSNFSMEEKKKYYMKKWKKEHISVYVIFVLVLIIAIVVPFVIHKSVLLLIAPAISNIGLYFVNNRMMAYVEEKIYVEKYNRLEMNK